jgi:hypothetical protein
MIAKSTPAFKSHQHDELKKLFESEGSILIRKAFAPELIWEWNKYSKDVLKAVFECLHEHGHAAFPAPYKIDSCGRKEYGMKPGVKFGFREIVMRSPGRYEVSLLHSSRALQRDLPPLDSLKESLSFVPSLLDSFSWDDIQICNLSLVMSTPGASEQTWHADGGHVSIHEHLPCHCFNIFIPLTDVTMENGPTELRPGTHFHTRNLAPMMLAAKARKTLCRPATPLLSQGDLLLFDYRLLHRGKANASDSDRTILVLTVAKNWFKDVLNFPSTSMLCYKADD